MMIPPRRLADGKVIAGAGDTVVGVVPLDGADRGRLRFKATVAGTLKFRYLRPDMVTDYDEFPADVPVLINDETVVDFASLMGEAGLRIFYTTVAGGIINYADWSAVSPQ